MAVWEFEVVSGEATPASETVRIWTIILSGIAFLLSFGDKELRLAQLRNHGLMVSIPACLAILLINARLAAPWLVVVLIVAGEFLACWAMRLHYGTRPRVRVAVIDLLACIAGCTMLWQLSIGRMDAIYTVILAQIFTACGLLFLYQQDRVSASRWIVAQGFLFWAAQYALYWWMADRADLEGPYTTLISLWYLPKYLVAFGMILRVMEEDQAQVRTLTEEYRLLYEGNPHPMFVFSPETGRFLSANEAALQTYGYGAEELREMSVAAIFPPEDAEKRLEMMSSERRLDKYQSVHRRKDGSSFYAEMTMYPVTFQNQWARFVLAVDTTENVELNRELLRQAQHDPLTGLPNRMLLEDRMQQWMRMLSRTQHLGALMTLDLDRFKLVNDTYGHLVGDECLKAAAQRLQSRVRASDTLARTGGEEFTLIVGQVSSRDGALALAESLLRRFDRPITTNGLIIPLTISIGVAMYPDDSTDLETLRQLSDDALYEAKRTGRNRVVFSDQMPLSSSPPILSE